LIAVLQKSSLAAASFIGPGVEIGSGAVVSAGSVVFENVPQTPWYVEIRRPLKVESRKAKVEGQK
jgi:acetyltransferase-like isoleucine patch superfamily enzyme